MKTDFEIQQNVLAELQWAPELKASEIGVSVKNGVVMLSGVVDTYYKKVVAEKATKKINGVKAVVEEIAVKLQGTRSKTDIDIAQAVLNALKWNSTVDETNVKPMVEKGVVTLEGSTEWYFQKISAQKAIENIDGIYGIINNLKVQNRLTVDDVKQKIKQAFLRHATLDSDKIKIEVTGEKVVLSGRVRSWAERKDAETTAWSYPGVMSLENKLEVDSEIIVINQN
jgi:osmotically-inducible protein OsmY